ncbi:MAG: hypothetical protein K2N16_06280 [Muribaculaceae bacterium]|nr:hypothetical protein [Muribaculaceae bacterium]
MMIAAVAAVCTGCIEDGFATSPSDQPAFSVDTLDFGVIYTDELSRTSRMVVYNRHSKGLNLQSVKMAGPNAELFRINVDGMSGRELSDIEIRAKDSIFVFVEATLPSTDTDAPVRVESELQFVVNGVTSRVVVAADGQDIYRLNGLVVDKDKTLTGGRPYRVTDSLVVVPGATLTLDPGVKLMFHDKAYMSVGGTLRSMGTPEQPVRLTGDRAGDVITGVSFDIMSRQWDCVDFLPSSTGNYMQYTEVSNTSYGVAVYGDGSDLDQPKLSLVNCRLRNSGECVLLAFNASIDARGCEFAEAGSGLVYLLGGNHRFDLCTASNHYLFASAGGAAWTFVDPENTEDWAGIPPTSALITNSITWGIGDDVSPGDLAGQPIVFNRCLFRSKGTDDDNFVDCIWDADPLFYTEREKYLFDYRLRPDSPAIGAAYPALSDRPLATDFYGAPRASDLGAYAFVN